ncbi:MAG: DUF934 domain-containing protein [Alphaproteobacteria bacterium]|nr:DUF934 domain-containing protein [Alphaproteobacteria bacterium]
MATLKFTDGELAPCREDRATEITLAEWREGARPEAGRFALALPNDAALDEVAHALARFDAIILHFPTFKDGRALSQARLLRARYGFAGEIRARGEVLPDQAFFMARAGFDAFEIDCEAIESFRTALSAFSCVYQRSSDDRAPVYARRAATRAAAA